MQKLSTILITSPELADFRRRLKSLETRVSLICPLFTITHALSTARWPGAIRDTISIVVSQRRRCVFALPPSPGIRACVQPPFHLASLSYDAHLEKPNVVT